MCDPQYLVCVLKDKLRTALTSSSSSPIRIRPSAAAGPSGLIPTTNMLIRDLSLLPARLSPRPFLSFSSSIMCSSPGRSAYLCRIFSTLENKKKKNRAWVYITEMSTFSYFSVVYLQGSLRINHIRFSWP